jgi:hypothetical protein
MTSATFYATADRVIAPWNISWIDSNGTNFVVGFRVDRMFGAAL